MDHKPKSIYVSGDVTNVPEGTVPISTDETTIEGGDVTNVPEGTVPVSTDETTEGGGDVTNVPEGTVPVSTDETTEGGGDVTNVPEGTVPVSTDETTEGGGIVTTVQETTVPVTTVKATEGGGDVTTVPETTVPVTTIETAEGGGDVTTVPETTVPVTTVVTTDGGVLDKACRDRILVLQSSINDSMADVIQLVNETIELIEEKNPEMPDDLFQRIINCVGNTSALFDRSLELNEVIQELTNNQDTAASCPVDDFEELSKDLSAKTTEWQAINDIIAGLPLTSRRVKRVSGMEILSQLQDFHAYIIRINRQVTVIVIHIIQIFTAMDEEENAKPTEIPTTERDTITELTSEIATITHKGDATTVQVTTVPITTTEKGGDVTAIPDMTIPVNTVETTEKGGDVTAVPETSVPVTTVGTTVEGVENPECRSGVLRLKASLNQSLSDGGDILLRVAAILTESRPDIPDSLRDDLSRCAADLERLFSATLELAKNVGLLVQSGTGACPVQQMEELLSDLEAKNEELAENADKLSQLPAASSEESSSFVTVITDVYWFCVSVQLQFITIFDEVSETFNNEETFENPECRSGVLQLQASLNQSLSDGGDILLRVAAILNENEPDLPHSLKDDLSRCAVDLEQLFNAILDLAKNVGLLVESGTGACPVQQMEELLSNLEAKNEELAEYAQELSQLPAASSDESASLVTVITDVYTLCVSVQVEFITIFDEVSEIFSNEDTIENPECRSGVLRVEASLNQSLSDGGDILLRVAAILTESRPDIPDSLRADLSRCAEDLEKLFTATLDLAKSVGLLVESGTGACPVQQMEELLFNLEAKNEELAEYAKELSQLPAASSDESASLVTVITDVYTLCVSVQVEFITIFDEVSEIFSNEDTIENPECRLVCCDLKPPLQPVAKPDLPNSLRDDLSRCAADLERLFTGNFGPGQKNVAQLVESGTGACPVQQMEELLSELVAKNVELAGYANELSQLPAASSDESASLVSVITNAYMLCVSVQQEFITIFEQVSEIFSNEETKCRSGGLRLEASLNQSLSDGGDILLRVAAILNESRPDLPNSLRDDLSRCAADLERLFTATSDLAKKWDC
ncbi:uncharacterized protein LOC122261209 [Penaeus japonicus]|uniref:uncharacterized protein LOC122261209 n=1 Tax=Penaeus japonicus TaxID=27405 RepID=UPI001C70F034|nr:uncharacterized protein LOC122261209 [Penaeus japonicus]